MCWASHAPPVTNPTRFPFMTKLLKRRSTLSHLPFLQPTDLASVLTTNLKTSVQITNAPLCC